MVKIILASNSPRRKELLAGLDVDFEVRVLKNIDESYPSDLPTKDIAEYISKKKAAAYRETMADDELVITADTIVVLDGHIFGKPADEQEAAAMLRMLSGKTHQVITGVCLTSRQTQRAFSVSSDVTFKAFTDEEIDYYVKTYKPLDKAGAYGIQEWIGYISIERIEGSYYNVMGLPVHKLFKEILACNAL